MRDLPIQISDPPAATGASSGASDLINVKDYGALLNRVTDDSAGFVLALAAVPAANPNRGAVVSVPRGAALINASVPIGSAVINLRLLGEGASPAAANQVGHGISQLLIGSQIIGFTYNLANTSSLFGGFQLEQLYVTPVYSLTAGADYTGGTSVQLNPNFPALGAGWPAAGSAWIQDGNKLGMVTWTSIDPDGVHLRGCSMSNESPTPGQTYKSGAVLSIDALGGIRSYKTSDIRLTDCTFAHFNNKLGNAYGWYNDGSAAISQYNVMTRVSVLDCFIGAYEDTTSSRWVECYFDGNRNATSGSMAIAGTTGYIGRNTKTVVFDNTDFSNYDILIDIDGGASGGKQQINAGRYEGWLTTAIKLDNCDGATVNGGVFTNSINGSVGAAITLGAGVRNCDIRPGQITNVAHKLVVDPAATGYCRLIGGGSPEGVEQATLGSHFLDVAGATWYLKATAPTTSTGWVAIPPPPIPADIFTANTGIAESIDAGVLATAALVPVFYPIDPRGTPSLTIAALQCRVRVLLAASTWSAAVYSIIYSANQTFIATLVCQLNAAASGAAANTINGDVTAGAPGSGAAPVVLDFTKNRYVVGAMASANATLSFAGVLIGTSNIGAFKLNAARASVTDWPTPTFDQSSCVQLGGAAADAFYVGLVSATGKQAM